MHIFVDTKFNLKIRKRQFTESAGVHGAVVTLSVPNMSCQGRCFFTGSLFYFIPVDAITVREARQTLFSMSTA